MSTDRRPLPATYASIVFKGTDLDPCSISSILKVSPTLSYKRGDRYSIKGEEQQRKFGLWVFSTKSRIHSSNLEQHLVALERIIIANGLSDKIQNLIKTANLAFRVDVYWYGAAGAKVPEISRSFHLAVIDAGGTVETDFHTDADATQAA